MSIRNLDSVFKPKSVALVGASDRPQSVGAVLAESLLTSAFGGPVLPVNPKRRCVHGVLAYPDVSHLPLAPELAVIATPPDTVPGIVAELGARGTKAAVVVTSGFGRSGHENSKFPQALLDAARPHLLRIVGPNCLGVMAPGFGLNASFSHVLPAKGDLAFVAQSGDVAAAVLDWATARGIGFSHLISLGDMLDVDFGDMLDYLALEHGVRAILLYVERITHARKFMSAARAAARTRPVVVVRAGRHADRPRTGGSHAAGMTGSDFVYDAAFQRAGMLRVRHTEELFEAVETLAKVRSLSGDRLAILTNGEGLGTVAADALADCGGRLASLSAETVERLGNVLPETWSRGNPVDVVGDAPGQRYADALSVLLEASEIDAILVLNVPNAVTSSTEAAKGVIGALRDRDRPVLTSWVGERGVEEARRLLVQERIPTYATPDEAVRAFMHLVEYRRNQELLIETPPSVPEEFAKPDAEGVRAVVEGAFRQGREWLSDPESKQVLRAYGISVVETRTAATPRAAQAVAADLGVPVALKILSPDTPHKTEVGGVVLDLRTPEKVAGAAAAMVDAVRAARPEARIDGFTVEPMFDRSGSHELIMGMAEDPQFGPAILFGHGGRAVEVIDDKAVALPPLNLKLAQDLVSRTGVHRLLCGYRGEPPADLEAIALALVKLSQLVSDFPEVAELDVNPLLAHPRGILALHARIRVAPPAMPGSGRLAIRPYPSELQENIRLPDGTPLRLRPIRPEDEPALRRSFGRLSREEVRLRFFGSKKFLSHLWAARLTQIDYDREMALVLTDSDVPAEQEIYAVVHLSADPDEERAEFAVIVWGAVTRLGLGRLLMSRIIDYARGRGIQEIYGYVLRDNQVMLHLCRRLGFDVGMDPDDPRTLKVRLRL